MAEEGNKSKEILKKSSIMSYRYYALQKEQFTYKKTIPPFSPSLTTNNSQKKIHPKITRYLSQKQINLNIPQQTNQFDQIQIEQDYHCYQVLDSHTTCNNNAKTLNIKETTSTASKEGNIRGENIPKFIMQKSKKPNRQHKSYNGIPTLQINKFQIVGKLGQGKFGKVYLVREKLTGFILALKVVSKKFILSSGFINQFIRELKIQSYLQHPNIIQLYGFFSDNLCFYTLMEFGCDGQLYNYMIQNIKFKEQTTSYLLKSLLSSVNYIHSLNILHRDIKPENIVLVHGAVKLCDFGWAVNKQTKDQLRGTFCGTPLYLSPQILRGAKYDQKVDLWAIGVLSFQFLTNCSPFKIQTKDQLYRIVTSQVIYPPNICISNEYRQFIEAILKKDPRQRMNSAQLMKMKFITMYEELEECEVFCQ